MNEKKYLIDDEPSSARDIIKLAIKYDEAFANSGFYQTSVAAGILQANGHTVEEAKVKS